MRLSRLLFTGAGRISPTDFWIGFAMLFAASLLALAVPRIGWLFWLATLYPWACVYAKRLHDLGHSAWLLLLPLGVNLGLMVAGVGLIGWSLVSPFIAPQAVMPTTSLGALIGALLLVGGVGMFNIVWWVWLGLSPGQTEDNRFGAPPRVAIG